MLAEQGFASRSPAAKRRPTPCGGEIHCRRQHGTDGGLCPDCRELLDYARRRLARCPFREEKPTCARCPVHCYRPAPREQIRAVMRYAGPRMLLRHPLLAILHLLDGRRPLPARQTGGQEAP